MSQICESEPISRDELVYWIDKTFIQDAAQARIGRSLNDKEMQRFTKIVEWGLWDSVCDTINVAIDETID